MAGSYQVHGLDDGIATLKQQQKLTKAINDLMPKLSEKSKLLLMNKDSLASEDLSINEIQNKQKSWLINSIYSSINHDLKGMPQGLIDFYLANKDDDSLHDLTQQEFIEAIIETQIESMIARVKKFLEASGMATYAGNTKVEKFLGTLRSIVGPLISEIAEYIVVYNRENIHSNIKNGKKTYLDFQTRWPELTGIANGSYQDFHKYLLSEVNAGKAKQPNVVLTDPPYFIGLANWDEKITREKVTEAFSDYLLSANEVLSDDGMFIVFNTKENVELLGTIVKDLSSDDDYPEFDYVVMDYREWVKSNPNRKDDAHYKERSEYLMLAYRRTEAGEKKFRKIKPRYQFGKDNEFFESAALTKPYDEMGGKGKINQTPKPPRMIKTAIQRLTLPDDVILDSFAGSASIAIAGYELGRTAYCCELSRYTQIKATNRLQRFKFRIGQRVLRCEPFADMTDFDMDNDDEDLVAHFFINRVKQLPQPARAAYVNSKLVDMLERHRQKYVEAHSDNPRAIENAQISTKLNDEFLTDEDRAMILGLSKYWGTEEFKGIFGFDSRSQMLVNQYFDPIPLNHVLRYRYNFMLDRHADYWSDYVGKAAKGLMNNKKKPTQEQVADYELYLLQLLNGLTFFEDKIQEIQDAMAHEDENVDFKLHDGRSKLVYAFYRIVAILVGVLDSLSEYFFRLGDDEDTNMDLAEHVINRNMFNNEDDIKLLEDEFRFIHNLAAVSKRNVNRAGEMSRGHKYYLDTSDTGNQAKLEALKDGNAYYREFIRPKFESGRIFEVPALTPIIVGKALNLQRSDLDKYQLYALSSSVPTTEKGYIKWDEVEGEFIRKSFDGYPKKAEEEYLIKTVKQLLNGGHTVIEVSKMLMLTQGTINNLRKMG